MIDPSEMAHMFYSHYTEDVTKWDNIDESLRTSTSNLQQPRKMLIQPFNSEFPRVLVILGDRQCGWKPCIRAAVD